MTTTDPDIDADRAPHRAEPSSPLDRRLAVTEHEVALADLPGQWFHGLVTVRCAGGAALAADPALPGRVRGAWGERLMPGASAEALAGLPCPWEPPCALDVFLRERGAVTGRLKVPQPYVVATEAVGSDLMVVLTLTGFATDWADTAADALVAALRAGVFDGSTRRPLTVMDRSVVMHDGIPAPATARAVALHFRTPLSLRSGDTMHGSTAPLLTSLGNRISGLARWQDARVVADWPALKSAAAALERDETALHPCVRHTQNVVARSPTAPKADGSRPRGDAAAGFGRGVFRFSFDLSAW